MATSFPKGRACVLLVPITQLSAGTKLVKWKDVHIICVAGAYRSVWFDLQAGPELMILLLQPTKCWDYGHGLHTQPI
jgi:hypothetical protein